MRQSLRLHIYQPRTKWIPYLEIGGVLSHFFFQYSMDLLEVTQHIHHLLLDHNLLLLLVTLCAAEPPSVDTIGGVCPRTALTVASKTPFVICIPPQMLLHVFHEPLQR